MGRIRISLAFCAVVALALAGSATVSSGAAVQRAAATPVVPSLEPEVTEALWRSLVRRPRHQRAQAECRPLRGVFYAATDWLRLATKLAATASRARSITSPSRRSSVTRRTSARARPHASAPSARTSTRSPSSTGRPGAGGSPTTHDVVCRRGRDAETNGRRRASTSLRATPGRSTSSRRQCAAEPAPLGRTRARSCAASTRAIRAASHPRRRVHRRPRPGHDERQRLPDEPSELAG